MGGNGPSAFQYERPCTVGLCRGRIYEELHGFAFAKPNDFVGALGPNDLEWLSSGDLRGTNPDNSLGITSKASVVSFTAAPYDSTKRDPPGAAWVHKSAGESSLDDTGHHQEEVWAVPDPLRRGPPGSVLLGRAEILQQATCLDWRQQRLACSLKYALHARKSASDHR